MMPRWIVLWIGGPIISAIFLFSGWTAVKGIGTAEHLVKVEAIQVAKMEAMQANIGKLMEHFNLVPIEPQIQPQKGGAK